MFALVLATCRRIKGQYKTAIIITEYTTTTYGYSIEIELSIEFSSSAGTVMNGMDRDFADF